MNWFISYEIIHVDRKRGIAYVAQSVSWNKERPLDMLDDWCNKEINLSFVDALLGEKLKTGYYDCIPITICRGRLELKDLV